MKIAKDKSTEPKIPLTIPDIFLFSAASAVCGAIATGLLRGRSVYEIPFIAADTSILSGAMIAGGMTALAFTILRLTLVSFQKSYPDMNDRKKHGSNFMKKYLWLSLTPFVIIPYAANLSLATAMTLVASSVFGAGILRIF